MRVQENTCGMPMKSGLSALRQSAEPLAVKHLSAAAVAAAAASAELREKYLRGRWVYDTLALALLWLFPQNPDSVRKKQQQLRLPK